METIDMIMIKKGFSALLLLMLLALANSAYAQSTRTLELSQGYTHTPAMAVTNLTGEVTYHNGFVMGSVTNTTNPTTFSFLLSFKDAVLIDSAAGIYSGTIISPSSSFAVTESVSRKKSTTTSGTIDSGSVTFRFLPDGRADIISVVSDSLSLWEGRNSKRRKVGSGTVDYGTVMEGEGTMVLNFF